MYKIKYVGHDYNNIFNRDDFNNLETPFTLSNTAIKNYGPANIEVATLKQSESGIHLILSDDITAVVLMSDPYGRHFKSHVEGKILDHLGQMYLQSDVSGWISRIGYSLITGNLIKTSGVVKLQPNYHTAVLYDQDLAHEATVRIEQKY
jgi:hypothetical protein